jgi:hypothetical protein
MKGVILGILASGLVMMPLLAALKTGDKAPDFAAKASLAGLG